MSILPNPHDELDERLRARLHEASHKSQRVTGLALLVALAFMTFYSDDPVPQIVLALVAFAMMASQAWYLKRDGVGREIETVRYGDLAREPIVSTANLRMFVLFVLLQTGSHYASGTLGWSVVPKVFVAAAITTAVAGWALRAMARREVRRADRDEVDPAYSRGRRLGDWIARLIRG